MSGSNLVENVKVDAAGGWGPLARIFVQSPGVSRPSLALQRNRLV